MFKRMEIAEAIYKGGAPYKNNQQTEDDRASSNRNKKGGESASPSNPGQVRAGKRKWNDAGHPSYALTVAKKTCLLHVPEHSSEDCKVIEEYT